jgi:hypothetical protein
MERMMDGGGGYDPTTPGSDIGMPPMGETRPMRKPATRKRATGAGGKKRVRKKAAKARGKTRARAKKASKKTRRR